MLHLIFQSPVEVAILERIEIGDAVVFIGDSVVVTLEQGMLAEKLAALAVSRALHVMADDIVMRGIAPDRLVSGIEMVDYSGLVALTIKHKVIQSWY